MKNTGVFKRILSAVLLLAMLATMVPVGAISVSAATFTQQNILQINATSSSSYISGSWYSLSKGSGTISGSGCGIVSLVSAVYNLGGGTIEKSNVGNVIKEVLEWAYSTYWTADGAKWTLFAASDEKFGSKYGFDILETSNTYGCYGAYGKVNTSLDELVKHLKNGGTAVVHVNNHYMAAVNYRINNGTTELLIFDPGASTGSRRGSYTAKAGSWIPLSILEDGSVKNYLDFSEYVDKKSQENIEIDGYWLISSTNPSSNSNIYSFNFNANGGTLGSTGAFTVSYGQEFQILNTTCTRDGYTWAGWNVKRNNDNTWYVAGQGWCTESTIASKGYSKKIYSNYQTCALDSSWTTGITGDASYTFYAVWSQGRQTMIHRWISEYGSGYSADQATPTTSGTTQNRYYYWFKLYDYYTGDLANSYRPDKEYTVTMNIYDSAGTSVYSSPIAYENSDVNWCSWIPQKADTYTCEVILTGGWTGTFTDTFVVDYDAMIQLSADNVSLDLTGTYAKNILVTGAGGHPGRFGFKYVCDNSNVSLSWGSWNGNAIPLTITGNSIGTTNVMIYMWESYTGNEEIVAEISLVVNVGPNVYSLSSHTSSATSVSAGQTIYYSYTPTLSGKYVIYSTGADDTKVHLYNSGFNEIASNDDGGDNRNFRLEYNLTAGTKYIYGIKFYDSSKTGTINYKFGPVCSVSYQANGGSGAPSTQSKDYGTDLTLSSIQPTRTGYTFLGWSTSSSASAISYYPGDTYISNSNITLYAVWIANRYTVTYNANGGSGAPSSQTKYHGTNLTLSSVAPTRTGYAFQGWSTSNTAAQATYQAGGTYTNNANVTLYAVWKANTYTVTYNANGGSGAPVAQTKVYGTNLTLSSVTPTRTGYTFQGWATSSSATTASYQSGGIYSNNAAVTLYAVWKPDVFVLTKMHTMNTSLAAGEMKYYSYTPSTSGKYVIYSVGSKDLRVFLYDSSYTEIAGDDDGGENRNFRLEYDLVAGTTYIYGVKFFAPTDFGDITFRFGPVYTVSYHANGGSNAPSAQGKDFEMALVLSDAVPTREGYTFQGWSTSSTATAAMYQPGGSYSANADATLYAVWNVNTYTVTYNVNGGNIVPLSQTKQHGTALILSSTIPTKAGHTFLGWSTSSTATQATYPAGGTYTANADVILYAVWEINTYKINYNLNGGAGSFPAQTKEHGTALTLSSTIPTKAGHTFLGWSTSSTATQATYPAGGTYTANTDATLYAVWQAFLYTVTYDANGGVGAPPPQTKPHGTNLTISSVIPERTGYTFKGWAKSSTATTISYVAGSTYWSGATDTDMTLYALWKLNEYEVTYDANGGQGAPSSQTKYHDVDLTLSRVTPSRDGYTFAGWAASSSATGIGYHPGSTYTFNYPITLYAVWRLNTYIVNYQANGGSGAPAAQTKSHGVDLTLSATVPTRDGYIFVGWATNDSSTDASYLSGATYSADANITLFAVWQKDTHSDDEAEMAPDAHSISLFGCNEIPQYVGANNMFTLDTADKSAGSASLALTLLPKTTGITRFSIEPVDGSGYDTLEFDMYVSDLSLFDLTSGGQLELSSSGRPDIQENNWPMIGIKTANQGAALTAGWNHVVLPLTLINTDFDISNVNFIGFYLVEPPIENAITVKLDNFRLSDAQAVAAAEVEELIYALPKLTRENYSQVKQAVEATRRAYEALSDTAKSFVGEDVLLKLQAAEADIDALIYGDANMDGVINGKDILIIRKYLANYNYDTGVSTVVVGVGADANGDGVINGKDILIIRKYLANYNYDTGKSTVVLGPNA